MVETRYPRALTSARPPIAIKSKMTIPLIRIHRALALVKLRAIIGTIRTIARRKETQLGNALTRSGNAISKESTATTASTTGQRGSIWVTPGVNCAAHASESCSAGYSPGPCVSYEITHPAASNYRSALSR
jgi:hypothetical protein